MASFYAVNTGPSTRRDCQDDRPPLQTPTTPRPPVNPADRPRHDADTIESSPNTPTRHTFAGMSGQRPLPEGPATVPATTTTTIEPVEGAVTVKRDRSTHSAESQDATQDVEMGDADHDDNGGEDDGSDTESMTGDGSRSSKKKKGQRFFCTDFPPCQLSFTRSEHLARHIRKHTGERPFQCHCSRRFSRLDNLRQHAQTVHVNEDIPAESLAATSTRFQRQIRTDRVRPTASRSRASTLGSTGPGGHSRGHGRNLSASSIASTASSLGGAEDARRRPQPLAMANDGAARARLSLETYHSATASPSQQYVYYNNQSPTGYSTPASTVYSSGGRSPRMPELSSPSSTISRSSYYNGARTSHGRRLSVPSAPDPCHNQTYPPAYFSPIPSGQSTTFSHNSSAYGSPTGSAFSHNRRESESDTEFRRRTWHPSTNSHYAQRPATSGLTYHQTPDEPRPAFTQHQAASQMTRLPGIESFDHAPPPALRQPDAMVVDSSPRPTSSGRELQLGLRKLDITAANAPAEGHWQVQHAPYSQQPTYYHQPPPTTQYMQHKHVSMPEPPLTPRKNKRNAWYGGPITPHQPPPGSLPAQHMMMHPLRPSPEDSGSSDGVPTPSTSQGNEYNPVIVNPTGAADYPPPGTAMTTDEPQKPYHQQSSHIDHKSDRVRTDSGYHSYIHQPSQPPPPPQTYALHGGHDYRTAPPAPLPHHPNHGMAKLEALVAVATSESSRASEHAS